MCGNRLLTLVSPSATSSRASSGRRMNLFMRHALALAPALLIIALGLERVSRLPGNVCLTCSDGLLPRLQSRLSVRIPLAPPASLQFSGFFSSLREKRAFGRNPAPKVHRRTALVGFEREF